MDRPGKRILSRDCSENSRGLVRCRVHDLIRLVDVAKEKGDYVPLEPNAFYFKSPPKIFPSRVESFNKLLAWLGS